MMFTLLILLLLKILMFWYVLSPPSFLLQSLTYFLNTQIPEANDPLRAIITELGGAPSQSSSDLSRARAEEVALTLSTRIRTQDGK